jgi:hypothetical protein
MCRELDHPVFTSLDFATGILFYRARSSAFHPTHLEDQVYIYVPQVPGTLVAFYGLQGYGRYCGDILTRFHTVVIVLNKMVTIMREESW